MVKPARFSELSFPFGGLNKAVAYQQQPPYSTPDAENVRPFDVFEGRQRGGSRPGLAKAYTTELADVPQLLSCVQWVNESNVRTNSLLVVTDGVLYSSSGSSLVAVAAHLETEAGGTIVAEDASELFIWSTSTSDSYPLRGASRGQSFYLADYGDILAEGSATISDNVLTCDTDLDVAGVDITRDICVITRTDYPAQNGNYRMSAVSGAVAEMETASLTDGNCSYVIVPGLKVFNPATSEFSLIKDTTGTPPYGCPLVCIFRDRLVLAGPDNVWYMSRQSDPLDWDYGADSDDAQRAMASSLSEASFLVEPITALIPHSDDFLIFGCTSSLWVLRGDPAYGGQLYALSHECGIVTSEAWCYLPDSSILFLAESGLYFLSPGATAYPLPFSRATIPQDLINVTSDCTVSMVYDPIFNGVHLSIVPAGGATGNHWWIDWETRSIWPVSFTNDDMQPLFFLPFSETSEDQKDVLIACGDGYVRKYDLDAGDDDGEDIASYVVLGAFRMAGGGSLAMLTALLGILDASSDDVTWEVLAGNSSQAAIADTTPPCSGTWSGGANKWALPRVSAAALALKLSSLGQWAIESITAEFADGGPIR